MPAEDRPRERLKQYGAALLSTPELLAIVLRTGTASQSVLNLAGKLLHDFGGLPGLARASFSDLCEVQGLGDAKTAQLKAALELGRRLLAAQPEERRVIRSPEDIANLLQGAMAYLEQEELRVVLLNTKNQMVGMPRSLYKGSINTSHVRVGELFRDAVRENCAAIVVVHNHPSGDPTPSPEDIKITEQMVAAGKHLDIEVLDHVIIGEQRYISLKEKGLGFG